MVGEIKTVDEYAGVMNKTFADFVIALIDVNQYLHSLATGKTVTQLIDLCVALVKKAQLLYLNAKVLNCAFAKVANRLSNTKWEPVRQAIKELGDNGGQEALKQVSILVFAESKLGAKVVETIDEEDKTVTVEGRLAKNIDELEKRVTDLKGQIGTEWEKVIKIDTDIEKLVNLAEEIIVLKNMNKILIDQIFQGALTYDQAQENDRQITEYTGNLTELATQFNSIIKSKKLQE